MIKLYYLPICKTINEKEYNYVLSKISEERRERIARYKSDLNKKISAYAEFTVRFIASFFLKARCGELKFKKGEFGKPYIENDDSFYFNVSHTDCAVAVAVSDREVGVDIEKIKQADLNVSNRFFSDAEKKFVNLIPDQSNNRFFEIWTKKEAYVKCSGKGFSLPFDSFNVLEYKISERIKSMYIDGYVISVCGEIKDDDFEFTELNESFITENLRDNKNQI